MLRTNELYTIMQKVYNQKMRRIFIKQISQEMQLDKKNKHYLKNVLRLACGTEIVVFDGTKEGIARIQDDKLILLQVTKTAQQKERAKLAVAQIQQQRMEWLVEKATEIGVDDIYILQTERTQKSIRLDRFEKIMQEAARQCMRITVPKVYEPIRFDNFVNNVQEVWYFGHIDGVNNDVGQVKNIMIGPEGGWTKEELYILQKKCIPLKLSENVLRSETAAIIGLFKVLSF